jgi:ribonuclease T1
VRLIAGLLALVLGFSAFGLSEGVIEKARLPTEAIEAIALIKRGGPFPYPRDGIAFGNRERLLPARARGWYREYTVRTPGERTRGARRIVAGRDGTLYYTDDHYRSFKRVLE